MRFELAAPARIVFGAGSLVEVAPAAKQMGRRALLVTGRSPQRAARLMDDLDAAEVGHAHFAVEGEPTVDLVRRGVRTAIECGCDLVIAFGGGSVMDAGKAIAVLLTNSGEPLDYLEVVGKGQILKGPGAPFIAIPTTAGTGAEVTKNAVLASPEHKVKASLRSPHMLARLAVVDPELTFDLPPAVTASTGLDALTQLVEPYVSSRANAMVDLFAVEGMRRAARALPRAFEDGRDQAARTDMAFASLLGGLSLANAGLGAAHGFAAPVGGMFPAPHGAVCAALLPHVMAVNIRALRARAPESHTLRRYEEVARLLTGNPAATPEDGARWVDDLRRRLQIPQLGRYGITSRDVAVLVANAAQASSMKANPITLTTGELTEILTLAL